MTRKELMRLMPTDGKDLPAATRIIELGYPTVAPVMRDMVRWMRVAESPVADAFAAFFAKLGEPAVRAIEEGLQIENCWLRHRVFCQILPAWSPEAVRQLSGVLAMIATNPDAYDNDILSVAVLANFGLADPQWLRDWIEFKKERWTARHELLVHVEELLKSKPDA